jgi:glucosamine-phosphate N-acetyltransferase
MEVTLRELTAVDLSNGFLETLARLADVGLSVEEAREVFRNRLRAGMHTFVALRGEEVIGTTSLLVEQKFIHRGGRCGHIEDVAVHPDFKEQGIGSLLVRHAVEQARAQGCYKVILSCFESLVPFYERLGFRRHDVGMRIDL